MKVRWTKESLRLRITPTELDALVRSTAVDERLDIPGGSWQLTVGTGDTTGIGMANGVVRITIAPADLHRLADPDTEGVYFEAGDPSTLAYYVEKDFPCRHPRPTGTQERETETFPSPADFKQRHKNSGL